MKKLYTAKVEIDLVVIADDKDEAKIVALNSFKDECFPYIDVEEMNDLPGDWELNCIPYGKSDQNDPDRTVEGWINVGAAPAYQERLEEQIKFKNKLKKIDWGEAR